jgi:hypothetical protein
LEPTRQGSSLFKGLLTIHLDVYRQEGEGYRKELIGEGGAPESEQRENDPEGGFSGHGILPWLGSRISG